MGSWGSGFFDNDDGSDLLYDLRRGNAVDLIDGALQEWERHRSGHHYALAGVASVTAAGGCADPSNPRDLTDLMSGLAADPFFPSLVRRSIAVVTSISTDLGVLEMEVYSVEFWARLDWLRGALAAIEQG